jgi:hypothetical protein
MTTSGAEAEIAARTASNAGRLPWTSLNEASLIAGRLLME